jgi:hypothetical protein
MLKTLQKFLSSPLEIIFHLHFPSNTKFIAWRSWISKPPTLLGLHTFSKLIQAIFSVPFCASHKKFLWSWTIYFQTFAGIFKKDR